MLVAFFLCFESFAQAQQVTGAYVGANGNTTDTQRVSATYGDGTTVTMVASTGTATSFFDGTGTGFSAQRLDSIGSPASGMYTPALDPSTVPAVLLDVEIGDCFPTSTNATTGTKTCDRGTLTVTFSRAVTDPVLHLSGIGGVAAGSDFLGFTTYDNRSQTILNVVTPGVTLQSTSNAHNLAVTSSAVTSTSTQAGPNCSSLSNSRGDTAGCGSVILKGTFTSVTFNVQIRSTRIYTSGDNNTTDDNLSDDTIALTFTTTPPPAANLTCSTQMYMIGGTPGSFYYTRTLQIGGTAGTTNVNDWRTSTNTEETASLAVSPTGDKLYSAAIGTATLRVYNVTTNSYVLKTIPIYTVGSDRILRMAVTSTGTGYMMSGTTTTTLKLWAFAADGTVSSPVPLSLSPLGATTTGLSPAPTLLGGNGDFFADSEGNLYMLWSPTDGSSYLDLYKIKADGTTYFLGRINDTDLAGKAYGGLSALGGKIYAVATDGTMVSIDLVNMNVAPIATANSARNTSDLASCYYPTLQPQLDADKTYTIYSKGLGNTSSNPQPGDTLEYKIVITNSGSLSSVNTKFYDAIPVGTTYVPNSTQMNFSVLPDTAGVMPFAVSGGRLINSPGESIGTVNVDTTANSITSSSTDVDDNEVVVAFRVVIQAGVTIISNQGNVTYLEGPNGGINSDDPTTAFPNDPTKTNILIADVGVTKTGSAYANPDGTIVYSIQVSNAGPNSAQNISVIDTLPNALAYISSTPLSTVGTDGNGNTTLTWTLASLAANTSQTYTVTVLAPSANKLQNDATSRAFTNKVVISSPSDSNTTNNTGIANTQMIYTKLFKQVHNLGANPPTNPIPAQSPSWSATGGGFPRDTLEYCIDFYNYGGADLKNYVVSDMLPSNVTIIPNSWAVNSGTMLTMPAVVFSGATVSYNSGTVSANIGTLKSGTSGTLCFRVKIN